MGRARRVEVEENLEEERRRSDAVSNQCSVIDIRTNGRTHWHVLVLLSTTRVPVSKY